MFGGWEPGYRSRGEMVFKLVRACPYMAAAMLHTSHENWTRFFALQVQTTGRVIYEQGAICCYLGLSMEWPVTIHLSSLTLLANPSESS